MAEMQRETILVSVRDFITRSKRYIDSLPEAVGRVFAQERIRRALAHSEKELKHSESLLLSALETTSDGLLVVDQQGKVTRFNDRFAEMWRIPNAILEAKNDEKALAFVLGQLNHPEAFLMKVKELYTRPFAESLDFLELKDGRVFERISKPHLLEGQSVGRVWSFRDMTERRKAEERLSYLAYRDTLTGLPNRALLQDRLKQALVQAERSGEWVIVLSIDLDRFKAINDTLGHVIGDLLLKAVAERLTDCARESGTVARLGDDEFIIVLTHISRASDAAKVAQKILDTLSRPFLLGPEVFMTASIGMTAYPSDADDIDSLLKNADTAMYRAKEQGRNNYQFYTAEMNAKALERMGLENDLRHALERDEFLLHYQPQVDLKTGQITGAEALARWNNPYLGSVPPARFIPILEETGLITQVGEWALRAACAQNQAWQAAGLPPIRMVVNLSGRQFRRNNLIETVGRVLKETGHDPKRLGLELTESVIMQDAEAAIAILLELNRIGIQISIDDYGTGYSSLNYLKRFPIHILKIDTSFVREVTTDPTNAAIAVSIITLAHNLNLKVVAEGVETEEQSAFLEAKGCDAIQGYYFSKALPAEAFAHLLREGRHLILGKGPLTASA